MFDLLQRFKNVRDGIFVSGYLVLVFITGNLLVTFMPIGFFIICSAL